MSKSTINTRHLTIYVIVDSPFHWVSSVFKKYNGESKTFDQHSIKMVVQGVQGVLVICGFP